MNFPLVSLLPNIIKYSKYVTFLITIYFKNSSFSQYRSEVAAMGPSFFGQILEFCREKGHGFIKPKDENDKIFVHISELVI